MEHKKLKRKDSLVKHRHHKSTRHRFKSSDIINYINFNFTPLGAQKITLGQRTQEELECVVTRDITSEHPWKYVPKELLLDSITYNYESELLPLRLDISVYPRDPLLLVYIADETRDHDEFVLCLTEKVEDEIAGYVNLFQKAIEEIVTRALHINAHPWQSLGSEMEIEEYIERNNRPLMIVEVEATYPIMFRKIELRLKQSEDVRDSYVELLQMQPLPLHVNKLLQTNGVQVSPCKYDKATQTVYNHKQNAATQAIVEYETIKLVSPILKKNLTSFTSTYLDFICDQIAINSNINFYTNDYLRLKERSTFIKPPKISKNVEIITFSDFDVVKDKLISSVCWHPILTGTVAIAYSSQSSNVYQSGKPKLNQLQTTMQEVNTVLIWCTNDELYPKLRLVCSKEITCVSFCPFNENIIVGTCTNGQIVLWDIKNRLEQVEQTTIFTAKQNTHKTFMSLFMGWMKDVYDKSQVSVTKESDLKYSHNWPVTGIQWLPPYCRINEFGNYELIAKSEPQSMQLVTCALDGSIFFWDLLAKPPSQEHYMGFQRTRSSALGITASTLNRYLRPIYKLSSTSSKKAKPMLTTSIITPPCNIFYECNTNRKLGLTERIKYKVNIKRPSSEINIIPEIYCGTCDGYFFKARWEGSIVGQGKNINEEPLIVTSIGRYHDAPITCISRHPDFHDIYLTIGGKVFAVWTDNLKDRPIFWRKSRQRYLHGMWESVIFQCIILSTDDGQKEVWMLTRRSDTFYFKQHLSGRMVLGIHLYPFTLGNDNFLGVAHYDGTFGIIFVPGQLKQVCYQKDSLRNLVNKEIERKKAFIIWQKKWTGNHQEAIRKRDAEINSYKQEKILKQKREEQQREKELQREEEKRLLTQKQAKPRPGHYFEYAREQWRIKEEENTRKALQARARLPGKQFLEQLMKPLKMLQKEEEKFQRKLKQRLQNSEKIFQDTVAMMFSSTINKEPLPPLDPYAGGDTMSVKNECIFEYLSDSKTAEKFMEENPYKYRFRWDDLLQVNIEKRRSMMYLEKKSHRVRYFHKKVIRFFKESVK